MKKTVVTILLSALTLGLLAGCGEPAASGDSGNGSAGGGSYTITIAHSTAENTAMHNTWLAFKDYVEGETDGAITVNIYPNGQMGGDREVVEAVFSLPANQRAAVHLFYYEGYSSEEIAAILGQRPGTVRSHLSRARESLRNYLK